MTAATARQLFLFGISTLFAVVAVGLTVLGFLIVYDNAWERWPQEADLAMLWTMEIFCVGSPEQRFGGALANRDGERLMRFMLAIGFDPDRSTDGVTPLTLALDLPPGAAVSTRKLRILLEAGADPNLVDGSGSLPLTLAVDHATADHLRLLLEHGARPDAVDGHGRSVLDRLADRRPIDRELFAALFDFGLDPCSEVHMPGAGGDRLAIWLAAHGLADLADRAATACAAKTPGGGVAH